MQIRKKVRSGQNRTFFQLLQGESVRNFRFRLSAHIAQRAEKLFRYLFSLDFSTPGVIG